MKPLNPADLQDALDHINDFERKPLTAKQFTVTKPHYIPLKELERYDDIGSWCDIAKGEWKKASLAELEAYRGVAWAALAVTWKSPSLMPPIVIVEAPSVVAIADGRGRVGYAIGMGWTLIPAVLAIYCGDGAVRSARPSSV